GSVRNQRHGPEDTPVDGAPNSNRPAHRSSVVRPIPGARVAETPVDGPAEPALELPDVVRRIAAVDAQHRPARHCAVLGGVLVARIGRGTAAAAPAIPTATADGSGAAAAATGVWDRAARAA